ncbi:Ribokinase-like protein [Acrodontium crateriforme]|uniref:pyridoxal kinase n=1 Tax=Acrodontium crateriforme TaxID=150365 RepID=A0AAQ3M7A8_9PEZI|nr:Ribokinase-like protein [Acrodontium crateriforme]
MADLPETHVLAIASHVTSGYVGNTMATFCMQTLGCEVSSINTVNYSNHVGYGRFSGRKSSPEEVAELYEGLKKAKLDNFDMMLSGYCPSATLVEQVGKIARELKLRATTSPGSFFWILDPVMGDNGRIYVAEDTVPAYKSLLQDADLILPNQFEAELLSGIKISDVSTMAQAISKLHEEYRLPHIILTSVRLPPTTSNTPAASDEDLAADAKISIIGSTATSDMKPRLFRLTVPALPVYFSGTGDMFASLMIARLREAAQSAGLLQTPSWRSPDSVAGPDLPLAKAAEKVLASMHAVLEDTMKHYETVDKRVREQHGNDETQKHLTLTRAAEVRVVRNARALREPAELEGFQARPMEIDA